MDDVTDVVFREVVAQVSKPDVFFTEFTDNISGFVNTFVVDKNNLVAVLWMF